MKERKKKRKDYCVSGNLRMERSRRIYKPEMTHTSADTYIHINLSCAYGNSRMGKEE